jgi:hypothetical protein
MGEYVQNMVILKIWFFKSYTLVATRSSQESRSKRRVCNNKWHVGWFMILESYFLILDSWFLILDFGIIFLDSYGERVGINQNQWFCNKVRSVEVAEEINGFLRSDISSDFTIHKCLNHDTGIWTGFIQNHYWSILLIISNSYWFQLA